MVKNENRRLRPPVWPARVNLEMRRGASGGKPMRVGGKTKRRAALRRRAGITLAVRLCVQRLKPRKMRGDPAPDA